MLTYKRSARQIQRWWGKRSLLTRMGVLWIVSLFVVRRILWAFATPDRYADIPRAIAVIDVYLVACYIELVGFVLLFGGLLSEFRRRKAKRQRSV